MRRGCAHKPTTITSKYIDWLDEEITGPDYTSWWAKGQCEYGNCMELLCPVCGCVQGGWGPVDCPCEDHIPWPDMRHHPVHAAVKPSAARYRPSRRR